jgi:uncharacterized membrane protein
MKEQTNNLIGVLLGLIVFLFLFRFNLWFAILMFFVATGLWVTISKSIDKLNK